jgi:mannitol/fructose-specific phosphotransferase system IIA component (Ntr-type)
MRLNRGHACCEMTGLLSAGMNLGDILTPSQIVPELRATNRWEAIDELIGCLVRSGCIPHERQEAVTAAVKKREMSMSTGIGFGIGIPHASTELIQNVTAAFGRSKSGVNFDALDNQPVHLVTLFLVPMGQFQRHLHTLASIAKVLRKEEFLRDLESAEDETAMFEVIRAHSSGGR